MKLCMYGHISELRVFDVFAIWDSISFFVFVMGLIRALHFRSVNIEFPVRSCFHDRQICFFATEYVS